MIDHDNLGDFRDAREYDLIVGNYNADRPLIEQWARRLGDPMLDLACGTGRMTIQLAQLGFEVTGVDITPEMLELAQEKAAEAGVSAAWVLADARSFQLGKQFAYIFMLENVFQFLLTRADQEAMLARVREHLQPDGKFMFETRNPTQRFLAEGLHPEAQHFATSGGRRLVVTEQQRYDPTTQIQHYVSRRRWRNSNGQETERTVQTALRYVYPQELEALLYYNGFEIDVCYGDWEQNPLIAASPAMICVCRMRANT